jgi:hypothetical protein
MHQKIFVTVSGGVAYVMEDTVPNGFEVEIIDFDNINAGDSFPSLEAKEYCRKCDLFEFQLKNHPAGPSNAARM